MDSDVKRTVSILGCGWLGEPLALHLVAGGWKVRGSTRDAGKAQRLAGEGIDMHLIDTGSLDDRAIEFFNSPHLVVNITSKVHAEHQQLLDYAARGSVRNILFVSSTSVYPSANTTVTEEDKAEPTPLYNIEELFRRDTRVETTVLRFGGLIGPGRHPGRFFRKGRPIPNPHHPVNLIHLSDCIGVIKKILTGGHWGQTFNAVSDDHPAKGEYYAAMAEAAGYEIPEAGEKDGRGYKIVSNAKARRLLNHSFRPLSKQDQGR